MCDVGSLVLAAAADIPRGLLLLRAASVAAVAAINRRRWRRPPAAAPAMFHRLAQKLIASSMAGPNLWSLYPLLTFITGLVN